MTSTGEWDTGDKSAMISIGTHSLFLSAAGPDRTPGQPIVLLMQGMGSQIDEWVAVRRLVLPFARWVQYDRSGLGRSESPPEIPEAISAASVARELDTLLKNAAVDPPFIIVCHSWGGLTSREFLHLRPKDIVGIVFVDVDNEYTYDGGHYPVSSINSVNGDLDWVQTTGLGTDHVLSPSEWEAVVKQMNDPRVQKTEDAESKGYLGGDPSILAEKKQLERQVLGSRPVSVIQVNTPRDYRRRFEAGVAAGNGTEEERAIYKNFLAYWEAKNEEWHRENLRLSSKGRYTYTSTSGHNVQMVEPELIAKETRWVLENV